MHQAPPQQGVTTFRATILLAGKTATRRRRIAKAVATLREERA